MLKSAINLEFGDKMNSKEWPEAIDSGLGVIDDSSQPLKSKPNDSSHTKLTPISQSMPLAIDMVVEFVSD